MILENKLNITEQAELAREEERKEAKARCQKWLDERNGIEER